MSNSADRPVRRVAARAARPNLAVKRIRPAYEQVAEQLRELVLDGTVAPGDRLPVEGDLSAEFGVSRSTIREAIRLLSSQSMVHTTRGPAGGTFVSAPDPASLRDYLETSIGLLSGSDGISAADLLEVRDLLEVPAARLAAARRSEEHLEAMRLSIVRERQQRDRGERFEQNQQFHSQVLLAAGNPLLTVVTDPVFRVIQTRFLKDEERPFYNRANDEHLDILDCIARGDGDAAADAMQRHLTQLRDVYGHAVSDSAVGDAGESSADPATSADSGSAPGAGRATGRKPVARKTAKKLTPKTAQKAAPKTAQKAVPKTAQKATPKTAQKTARKAVASPRRSA